MAREHEAAGTRGGSAFESLRRWTPPQTLILLDNLRSVESPVGAVGGGLLAAHNGGERAIANTPGTRRSAGVSHRETRVPQRHTPPTCY